MVVYHLMTEGHSVQLGIWGSVPPAAPGQCLGGGWSFLKLLLNIDLAKIFEKLK